MRFTIYTGLKASPFELYRGRKSRSELTKIVKSNKNYLPDWTKENVSIPVRQILIYVARSKKVELTDHIFMVRKRNVPRCSFHKLPKWRPVKPVSGNFWYPYTFIREKSQKQSAEGKCNKQPEIAVDGTKHTVRTADNRILHRKLVSTPLKFQWTMNLSPNKNQLWGPGGKYVSASEKTPKMEEGIISESKSKVQKCKIGQRRQWLWVLRQVRW